MSNLKDFATGLVLTAPSPATSGTSITLETGKGSLMPAVPFNATVSPDGELPTLSNAEKVIVTARSSDTLTITRAQGDTTAKTILAGWRLSNTVFAEDLKSGLYDGGNASTAYGGTTTINGGTS